MKKITLKALLMAAALGMGGNAWAYDVPEGMEVKEVLIGTLSDGNVVAEGFESDAAEVPSFTNSDKFAITDALPTDVWSSLDLHMSGKALRLGSRTTHEIDFSSAVSKGQIVFATDFYVGTHQKTIKFIDQDNNVVARFAFSDKSASNGRVYDQQYLFTDIDDAATFSSTPALKDTYQGTRNREYQITEFVINLDANTITYAGSVMDRRSSANKWCTDNATITLSKGVTIKGVVIDATACGSADYYGYFDNMKLFSVGNVSGTLSYSVKAMCGEEELRTIAAGNATTGSTYNVTGIPEVIIKDGKYYQIDPSINNHSISYTMGEADEVRIINYTLNNNIIYFGEWETAYSTTSGNYKVRDHESLSGGSGRTINRTDVTMNLSFTVPVAGEYLLEIPYYNENSSSRTHIIYLDEDSESGQLASTSVNSNTSGVFSQEVFLTAGTHSVIIKCTYNVIAIMDYLKVELTKVSKSITSAGYATYYSPYALDFTGTGLTAYVATVDGDNVSFTEVDKVPANTGVLLKGAQGTYAIPVTANGGSATSAMVGVTVNTDVPAGIFVLLDGEEGVGFYETKNTFTVGANTAYIPASGTEGSGQDAKRRFIAIENDDATAITAIEAADAIQNGVIYNLSGQRVVKPLKGIYIQNGKKILVK